MTVTDTHGLARAFGEPVGQGCIRRLPEDFRVMELPLLEPAGEGEHAWLQLRKRCLTTPQLVKRVAAHVGVREREIGYAGLKDRNAVTTQWLSVHLPGRESPDWQAMEGEEIQVLACARHARKLQRGALRGNTFIIRLRELDCPPADVEQRLQQIAEAGVPNYFGEQRFGRGGSNLHTARRLFANPRIRLSRTQRSLALSAARALCFNRVLSQRVEQQSWNRPLSGDAMQLDGSRSFFVAETVDDALLVRVREQDVHPTGPLPGSGESPVTGESGELEMQLLETEHDLVSGLRAARVKQDRRALRVRVQGLEWGWPEAGVLELRFSLPPGSYATAVLRELVDYRDCSTG